MTRRTLLIDIEIEGNPVPKERPRVESFATKDGRRITKTKTPPRTAEAESRISWAVKAALVGQGGADDAPYVLEVAAHERRDRSHYADGDNVLKLVGDALNGVVWCDDSQVIEHHVYTFRNVDRPRTEIRIWRIE